MSCKSATELIEKAKVSPLSIKELVSLRLHLSMCGKCSDYKKLSNQIDKIMDTTLSEEKEESCPTDLSMTEAQKKKLMDLLNDASK